MVSAGEENSDDHSKRFSAILVAIIAFVDTSVVVAQETTETANFRKPKDDADLRYWLENMVCYDNFTRAEIMAATGLKTSEIDAALKKFTPRANPPTASAG